MKCLVYSPRETAFFVESVVINRLFCLINGILFDRNKKKKKRKKENTPVYPNLPPDWLKM